MHQQPAQEEEGQAPESMINQEHDGFEEEPEHDHHHSLEDFLPQQGHHEEATAALQPLTTSPLKRPQDPLQDEDQAAKRYKEDPASALEVAKRWDAMYERLVQYRNQHGVRLLSKRRELVVP